MVLTHSDHEFDSVEHIGAITERVTNVDKKVVKWSCLHQWRERPRTRIGAESSGRVPSVCRGPLHWSANTVSIVQPNVVSHANFVSVVQNWCSRHC